MLDAHAVGACMYVPATHQRLADIVRGMTLANVRTLVICTEDAVADHDLPFAMKNVLRSLPQIDKAGSRNIFLRPRNLEVLRRVVSAPGAERLDGYVLPKACESSLLESLSLIPDHVGVMPTLETREVFCEERMRSLRDCLAEYRDRVICMRIGGNDLLALLGMRRPVGTTLYETPLGHVISRLATTWIPEGFSLAAPVFEYVSDVETLRREIRQDMNHGLIGKTAIHPSQVPVIEGHYQVEPDEVREAMRILALDAPGVFKSRGGMCEPATHRPWAQQVLRKAQLFGDGMSEAVNG
ncbi:MAG: HpcH/HpaI aldolase/citrate lyase family protein [Caldilineaceae bacterium]|nr:HpcH/HpaI aldolase/citrate lyase family protein [Caldilineaceae bacterium]